MTIPPAQDNLCFGKALVIAKRHANNDVTYKTWTRKDRRPPAAFLKEARALYREAGVEEGVVDSSQFDLFQKVLLPERIL